MDVSPRDIMVFPALFTNADYLSFITVHLMSIPT